MSKVKISALSAGTPAGADLVPIVQGGVTKKGTAQGIANLAKSAVSGSFTTADLKTVTVVNGIITAIA